DTGHGMDRKIRQKVFEPYFTTKDVGKGTGLGLSVSYGIIKKMQGRILVQSELNKGSVFTIKLLS
ncbi:MAG: histidine kinase, partial [Bacteroidales bacterium]|nr:histidine kinase [Bacteroidales bacterium]